MHFFLFISILYMLHMTSVRIDLKVSALYKISKCSRRNIAITLSARPKIREENNSTSGNFRLIILKREVYYQPGIYNWKRCFSEVLEQWKAKHMWQIDSYKHLEYKPWENRILIKLNCL